MGDETPKKKNWKTTVGGFVAGLVMIAGEVFDLLGVQVENVTDGEFSVPKLMLGLGAIGLGWFARDKDVSSEESGAK